MQVMLRSDNTSAIQASMEYQASSPIMNQLAAEISLQLAVKQLLPLFAQHVPGVLNDIADQLSKMKPGSSPPAQLNECKRLTSKRKQLQSVATVKGMHPACKAGCGMTT